jgi:hypothetical protein
MATQWEYLVVGIHHRRIGGAQSAKDLQEALNDYGSKGWRAISIVGADIKGRIGPGAVEGLMVTFEREKH